MLYKEFIVVAGPLTAVYVLFTMLKLQSVSRRTLKSAYLMALGLLMVTFFIPNQWVVMAAGVAIVSSVRNPELMGLPLLCLLLFLVPPVGETIGIPGLIGKITVLEWVSFLILLFFFYYKFVHPSVINRDTRAFKTVEMIVIFYCLLLVVLGFQREGLTGGIRNILTVMQTAYFPFWIATRMAQDELTIRRAMTLLLFSIAFIAGVGWVEGLLSWHPYTEVARSFTLAPGSFIYLDRGGILRAYGSIGKPLVYGASLAVAVSCWAILALPRRSNLLPVLGIFIILAGALFFSGARGGWISSVVGLAVFFAVTRGVGKTLVKGAGLGFIGLVFAAATGALDKILNLIPFLGETDASTTVDYRVRLFEIGSEVVMKNPLFGRGDFLADPMMEQLRQGQNIIDIVNTYLGVALEYGLVGMVLYAAPPVIIMVRVWKRTMKMQWGSAQRDLGGAITAILVQLLVVLATTSPLAQLPYLLILFTGVGAAYLRSTEPLLSEGRESEGGVKAGIPPTRVGEKEELRAKYSPVAGHGPRGAHGPEVSDKKQTAKKSVRSRRSQL